MAGSLSACARSQIVRVPVNAKAPCADARFLYTDWVGKAHGRSGFYRCDSPESTRRDSSVAAAERSAVTLILRH